MIKPVLDIKKNNKKKTHTKKQEPMQNMGQVQLYYYWIWWRSFIIKVKVILVKFNNLTWTVKVIWRANVKLEEIKMFVLSKLLFCQNINQICLAITKVITILEKFNNLTVTAKVIKSSRPYLEKSKCWFCHKCSLSKYKSNLSLTNRYHSFRFKLLTLTV